MRSKNSRKRKDAPRDTVIAALLKKQKLTSDEDVELETILRGGRPLDATDRRVKTRKVAPRKASRPRQARRAPHAFRESVQAGLTTPAEGTSVEKRKRSNTHKGRGGAASRGGANGRIYKLRNKLAETEKQGKKRQERGKRSKRRGADAAAAAAAASGGGTLGSGGVEMLDFLLMTTKNIYEYNNAVRESSARARVMLAALRELVDRTKLLLQQMVEFDDATDDSDPAEERTRERRAQIMWAEVVAAFQKCNRSVVALENMCGQSIVTGLALYDKLQMAAKTHMPFINSIANLGPQQTVPGDLLQVLAGAPNEDEDSGEDSDDEKASAAAARSWRQPVGRLQTTAEYAEIRQTRSRTASTFFTQLDQMEQRGIKFVDMFRQKVFLINNPLRIMVV
jgi:hypothetical protein